MKDPAFLFYVQDFIMGTMFMSDEEVGIYIRLLCAQHQQGGIIKKSIFESKVNENELIKSKFIEIDDGYFNERLMKEMEKRSIKSTNLSANALAKWHKREENSLLRSQRMTEARKKGTHSKEEWEEMKSFFKVCVKCGSLDTLCKDHIIPIYQGGSDSITNIQPLCHSCNSSKGPDNEDYRLIHCENNGIEMAAKWLQNGCNKILKCLPSEIENEINNKMIFEKFRIKYPGTKRGLETEFENFKKKFKNYQEILPLLLPAITKQIKIHEAKIQAGLFTPEYPHLSTWINQRRWETEETFEIKSQTEQTTPSKKVLS